MGSSASKKKNKKVISYENYVLWLVSGYFNQFNDCKTELPLEINKTIQTYVGELCREMAISFDKKKVGKYLKFITNSRIKKAEHGWSTAITNQILSNKISNKWRIKFQIRSARIYCLIGYALKNGIKKYDQALGQDECAATSTGICISCDYDYYKLFDQHHFQKELKYQNQTKTKLNDEYELEFDLKNNKIWITHNDKNPIEIEMNAEHKNKELIPAISMYQRADEIEILCLKFQ
eukprot:86805_1